jgi:hypothetical protein
MKSRTTFERAIIEVGHYLTAGLTQGRRAEGMEVSSAARRWRSFSRTRVHRWCLRPDGQVRQSWQLLPGLAPEGAVAFVAQPVHRPTRLT